MGDHWTAQFTDGSQKPDIEMMQLLPSKVRAREFDGIRLGTDRYSGSRRNSCRPLFWSRGSCSHRARAFIELRACAAGQAPSGLAFSARHCRILKTQSAKNVGISWDLLPNSQI